MYRLLEIGEAIMDGDEFMTEEYQWEVYKAHIGQIFDKDFNPTRRKIPDTIKSEGNGNYTVNNYNKITVMGRIGDGDKEKKIKKSKWNKYGEVFPVENTICLVITNNSRFPTVAYFIDNKFTHTSGGEFVYTIIKWRKLPKVD